MLGELEREFLRQELRLRNSPFFKLDYEKRRGL
jgi:hypothetical protein